MTFAGMRRMDTVIEIPERQLELLLDIPMFTFVARADLERIARRMERLETQPGDTVVVEGKSGDRFYVIDAGQFAVDVAGERAPTLEEGDHFGEIALLHDVLRTATITSVGNGVIWALDREDFLTAITGTPPAHRAAYDVSVERLERQ
jgi:CRP-like cAMP-binding protein